MMMDFDIDDEELDFAEDAEEDINILDLEKSAGEAPVVKLVNLVLIDAPRKMYPTFTSSHTKTTSHSLSHRRYSL